jgi:methylated-DNA-[protein]-cysteine S-methyltransferase
MFYDVIPAPFGKVSVVVDGDCQVHEIWTSDASARLEDRAARDSSRTAAANDELQRYFDGSLREFTVPLALKGSPFQLQVWRLLREIPYGHTRTYGELARKLGLPDAARAVGRANATNPIAIMVPCHRVIGSSGALTGYAGGLDVKRALLEIESSRLGNLFS